MQPLAIILLIVGSIILIIGGLMFGSSKVIVSKQENWDKFVKKCEEQGAYAPEEALYDAVLKIKQYGITMLLIGGVAVLGGVVLIIGNNLMQ